MSLCSDPTVTYLKSIGYSVVRLPRSDMRPLQLLADYGRELTNIGEVATITKPGPGTVLPSIAFDQPGPSIAGQNATKLSVGLGLNVLGGVLGAMGAGNLGLDVAYKSAATVTFEFTDTKIDRIEIAAMDKYLGAADIDPNARGVSQMIDADDVYVVSATIKSTKITVSSKTSSGTDVALRVPVIKEIVGGNVSISASGENSSTITYEGKVPLVFGFQAIRLFYDQGHYTSFEPLGAGEMAAKALLEPSALPKGVQALSRRAGLVRVSTL